ncbi:hypothetical protein TRICI_004981 [Trichomonascus ciferrii]|uniref:Arrestin-like N-terminal domain-containing protein n=1 Tax=Trichomonascus ciferrii TaxID=44093 RepID=A0A642UY07_9ASCO|nr:hypothetical protein TRICI_004981 [Trichomonascus ciferrii]
MSSEADAFAPLVQLDLGCRYHGVGDLIEGCLKLSPRHVDIIAAQLVVELVVQIPSLRDFTSETLDSYQIPLDGQLERNSDYLFEFSLRVPHYDEAGDLLPPGNASGISYFIRIVQIGKVPMTLKAHRVLVYPEYPEEELRESLGLEKCISNCSSAALKKGFTTSGKLSVSTNGAVVLSPFQASSVSLVIDFCSCKCLPPKITGISYKIKQYSSSLLCRQASCELASSCLTTSNCIRWIKSDQKHVALLSVPVALPAIRVPSFTYRGTTTSYAVSITISTTKGKIKHKTPILALTN